ncbi:MAG: glycosyltransferase family 2 protein [Balneolaceae bacterium]|nr:glycosyltransferase family 2 protein [Balneolaceae bacterium]
MNRPEIHIILVNWNGWRDTLECIASLEELDYPNARIVVVDNGSTNDSVRQLRSRCRDHTLLESGRNLGFAGGTNLGIRHAMEEGADYLWILNNDTVVESQALDRLLERMQGEPRIGICGSRLIYLDQPEVLQALGGGTYNRWLGITRYVGEGGPARMEVEPADIERQLDYISGASMLVSRRFIEEVGPMNEEYFLYYEELDWMERAGGRFELGFAPHSVVYHKEGASIKANTLQRNRKSKRADYYQLRNRLLFTRNYHPLMLPTVYLGLLGALLNRIFRKQWDRVPMILGLMAAAGGKEERWRP